MEKYINELKAAFKKKREILRSIKTVIVDSDCGNLYSTLTLKEIVEYLGKNELYVNISYEPFIRTTLVDIDEDDSEAFADIDTITVGYEMFNKLSFWE